MRHVVMYSGGIGSWYTAKRVAERGGDLILLFADVGGKHTSPHDGEDEDCYRFINETAQEMGATLVTLNTGESIWDVFKRRRFLGNSRIASCSSELKQKPCRQWLDDNCTPADTTVYVGIDWTESHRLPAIQSAYLPYAAEAPLTEPPYVDKRHMIEACRGLGIEPPRLYAAGFSHANCGGGCVKAGQGHYKTLLRWHPERFAYWEAQEQSVREHLNADVAILRDHANGGTPLTLRAFRERLDNGQMELFDADDIGGCGCFVQETDPQITPM